MCIRIFPDFIASSLTLNRLDFYANYLGIGLDEYINRSFINECAKLSISSGGCVERQSTFLLTCGNPHAFIGYQDSHWKESDYERYFNSRADVFMRKEFYYTIEGIKKCADDVGYKIKIKDFIQAFCISLLSIGAYSPLLLKRHGYI